MRPDQRDETPRRQETPNLRYAPLHRRLLASQTLAGKRSDRAEYKRDGFLTLYRSTQAARWDVTATEYQGEVTIYLNHTRIAVLTPSTVTLYADPHMQVRQVRTWLNRVLRDNSTGHYVGQDQHWYVQDKALDPTGDERVRFTSGYVIGCPDPKAVLANV
jgi:hypothetical protein